MQGTTSRLRSFAGTVGIWLLSAGGMASFQASAAPTAGTLCNAALQPDGPIGRWNLELGPERASTLALSLPGNRTILLVAREVHVDVDLVVSTPAAPAGRSGNPIRREGVMRVLLRTDSSGRATISLHAMVDGGMGTRVTLQAYPFDALQPPTACQLVTQALAAGDAAFAQARQISAGLAAANPGSAQGLFDRAYQQYVRAFVGLAPENLAVRADVAHGIAALLCKYLGLWQEADHWSALAARLFELEGNANGRADAQSLQAWAWMELAQLPDAATAADPVRGDSHALVRKTLQQLQRLAAFYITRHQPFDAAEQLNYAGLTLYNAGEYERALDSYGRAQKLYAKSGDHFHLALALQNIALVQWDLGRSSAALKTFHSALNLVNTREYPDLSALILDNAGLANRTAGHLDTALAMHAQALELTDQVQDGSEHGLSLFGIGMVYSTAGDRPLAANFLRQALAVSSREGEGRDLVSVLRALAMVEAQEGHHEEAIRLDREALAHATGPIVRVHLLAQIADSESLLGRDQAATNDLALARKIPQTDDAFSRAVLEQERGVLDYRAGRLVEARTRLQAALAIDNALGLDAAAFDADVALARVDSAAGASRRALRDLDAGLRLSEVLRVQVSDPELRATSMEPLRPAFELKVDLLAQAYQRADRTGNAQDAERAARDALAVTERSRSRVMQDIALADYTQGTEARVDHLLGRKSQLLGDLAAHEDRLEARGVRATTDPRVVPIRADIAVLREQLALVDSQLAVLSQPATRGSRDRAKATGALAPDAAIIAYWIGATNAYAWIQTQSQTRMFDLGSADAVRKSADAVHSAYDNPDGGSIELRLHTGAQLSQLVLQPVLLHLPPRSGDLLSFLMAPFTMFPLPPCRCGRMRRTHS